MKNVNKKLIYLIVGSGFVGGLLGVAPPVYTSALTNSTSKIEVKDTTKWKSISFLSLVKDSISIEERIKNIESMMAVDMSLMTTNHDTTSSLHSSISLYTYKNAKSNEEGRNFIKQYESLSLDAYKLKGESRYTIGYGHVIYENNIPHHISKQYAEELFNKDMEKFDECVRDMLSELDHRFTYTQGFVNGLVSLTYNCGPEGVKKTRFWQRMKNCRYDKKNKCINKDDLVYAIEAVKTANISRHYANGHKNRRKAEHATMKEEV